MRGKQAPKRKIDPDPKYNNFLIAKFINYIMKKGKKSTAQRIVYKAFDNLKDLIEKEEKKKINAVEIFDRAVKNASPQVEVRSRRIGGANYQIPIEVRGNRRISLAFRWIIEAAKKRKGKPMAEKLALELYDVSRNLGGAIKKKEDVYRMARANRAFAHFGKRRR